MMNRLIVWFYKKRGYGFDPQKRLLFKSVSSCHQASTHKKVLINGKPLKHEYRWYVNKTGTALKKGLKDTQFEYCDECGKKTKLDYKFKHLRGL